MLKDAHSECKKPTIAYHFIYQMFNNYEYFVLKLDY